MTQVINLDDECELCQGETQITSGAEIMSCPVCSPKEVKNEFEQINLSGLTPKILRTLLDLGWELRDAVYALRDSHGDAHSADAILRDRARRAAEASDLDVARLHSELDKVSKQSTVEASLRQGLKNKDPDTLLRLEYPNQVFREVFSSEEPLRQWLHSFVNDSTGDLLFIYFKLRMQAFKWYPIASIQFFKHRDDALFNSSDISTWLQGSIDEVQEGLYSLGSKMFQLFELDSEVEVCEPPFKRIETVFIAD